MWSFTLGLLARTSVILQSLTLFALVFSSGVLVSTGTYAYQGHYGLHHSHLHHREIAGADEVVQHALDQIRAANKYRLEHPRFNNYEFSGSDSTNKSKSMSMAKCDVSSVDT